MFYDWVGNKTTVFLLTGEKCVALESFKTSSTVLDTIVLLCPVLHYFRSKVTIFPKLLWLLLTENHCHHQ